MRPIRSAILAGLGVAALAGAAYAAANEHVLSVRLPDGGIERIRYVGETPPRVVLVPAGALAPIAFADPFAEMDAMAAAMDAHADAMMRQAATLAAQAQGAAGLPSGAGLVSAGALPPGTASYSVVSTTINGKTCTRSTRLIAGSADGHAQPQLVSQTSGDGCAAAPGSAAPATRATAPIVPVSTPAPTATPPRGPTV